VAPFAGFWSKDAIIAAVHEKSHDVSLYGNLYILSLITAFLTAFYTFRAFFLTFYGPEKVPQEAGHHAHESPKKMTVPLMILAAGALLVGAVFELTHSFEHFLGLTPSLAMSTVQETWPEDARIFHKDVALVSTVIAVAGVALAGFIYLGDRKRAAKWADNLRPIYWLSYGKFFIDQIYMVVFVGPLWLLSQLSFWIDRNVIDGLVNLVGKIPPFVGATLRSLQTGMVQFYALAMVLGLLVLIGTLLL
jgi:NADH-quinone oxidoreductase subunit L